MTYEIDKAYPHRAVLTELGFRFDKETKVWSTDAERNYLLALIEIGRDEHPATSHGEHVVRKSDPAEMHVVAHRNPSIRWDKALRLWVAPNCEEAIQADQDCRGIDLMARE